MLFYFRAVQVPSPWRATCYGHSSRATATRLSDYPLPPSHCTSRQCRQPTIYQSTRHPTPCPAVLCRHASAILPPCNMWAGEYNCTASLQWVDVQAWFPPIHCNTHAYRCIPHHHHCTTQVQSHMPSSITTPHHAVLCMAEPYCPTLRQRQVEQPEELGRTAARSEPGVHNLTPKPLVGQPCSTLTSIEKLE